MSRKQIDPNFADEHIRQAIEDYDPMLTTDDANVSLIREKIIAAIESGKAPYFRFDRPDHILPAIKAANLPLKAEIQNALRDAWVASSYQRCAAYNEAVLDEARAGGYVDLGSSQLFLGIIQRLGQQHGWAPNAKGTAELAQASEAETRQRLIQSITQGKDSFQIYGRVPGESTYLRTFPASSLDDPAVTLEKLRELDAAAADVRRKRGMDRDEIRADLQQRSDEARGTRIFRPGDRTELDIEVRYKDGAGNALEIVGDGPKSKPAAGPMDRSVPVAESAKQLFVDPTTGAYYTPLAIKKLFTTNPKLIRTMLRTDLAFTNRLLNAGN